MRFAGFNLPRWAGVLQGLIATDTKGEDSAAEAARALVEVLEPEHVERLTEALVETVPGMAQKVTGRVLEELCEEVTRREDSTHSHATVQLIQDIEEKWRNDA